MLWMVTGQPLLDDGSQIQNNNNEGFSPVDECGVFR